jgi:hypothetical protein
MSKRGIKQWITYKDEDNNVDLVFNTTDNHYLHGWFEDRGFNEYKNSIKLEDIEELIKSINESVNCLNVTLSEFVKYFPDRYIESYLMYYSRKYSHMGTDGYIEHLKKELSDLFEILYELTENMGMKTMEYNVYYKD